MIIEDSSDFKLSTGRTIYANNLLIGISPDMSVTGGYDSSLDIDDTWTAAEKIELAEYMIGLWTRFRTLAVASMGKCIKCGYPPPWHADHCPDKPRCDHEWVDIDLSGEFDGQACKKCGAPFVPTVIDAGVKP